MPEIIPAIIAKDFEELEKKIKLVEPYVKWVQLDVMDGKFAPEKSWDSPDDLKRVKTSLNLEAHLMIFEPEKEIDKWIASGVKRILIHTEATKNAEDIIAKIKNAGLQAGVVLMLQTPLEALSISNNPTQPPLNLRRGAGGVNQEGEGELLIDVVQFMAIAQIGYHGQPFDRRVIPKIEALRAKHLDVKIAVDGGISVSSAKELAQAGADILVAGSAVFESGDINIAINKLKDTVK